MKPQTCACQLHALVALINKAATAVESQKWAEATDILQGQVTPKLQSVTHDVWLHHHKSGTGEA